MDYERGGFKVEKRRRKQDREAKAGSETRRESRSLKLATPNSFAMEQ